MSKASTDPSDRRVLVVIDDVEVAPAIDIVTADSVTLISFTATQSVVTGVQEQIPADTAVEHVTPSGDLDRKALEERDDFVSFVSSFPDGAFSDRLSSLLTFHGDLSLWWFNRLSAQRSDVMPTFTRLCQLAFLQDEVPVTEFTELHILTHDEAFHHVVSDYCDGRIKTTATAPPESASSRSLRNAVKLLLSQISYARWVVRAVILSLVTRLFFASLTVDDDQSGTVMFHTVYPHLWTGDRTADQKYRAVPDRLIRDHDTPVLYAVSVLDGYHQQPSIREYIRLCRELEQIDANSAVDIAVIDATVRPGDLFRFGTYIYYSMLFLLASRTDRFSSACEYRGVDITPLIRTEFRDAARTVPHFLTHAERVRRTALSADPATLVTYLFELCYGRATIYGAKRGAGDCTVVGVQHGPISKRKLMYYYDTSGESPLGPDAEEFTSVMPTPDHLIAEGTGGRDRLVEAGYDPQSVSVCGAPRVRDIDAQLPNSHDTTDEKPTVLVGFGHSDAEEIMSACLGTMESTDAYHFVFKPHPKSSVQPPEIRDRLAGRDLKATYDIVTGDFYEALQGADLLVTTYSSVGVEALILGYPVVCLLLPNVINGSPLLDGALPQVVTATGANDLAERLDAAAASMDTELTDDDIAYFFANASDDPEGAWATQIATLHEHGE